MILFLDGGCVSTDNETIFLEQIKKHVEKEEIISVKIGALGLIKGQFAMIDSSADTEWKDVCRYLEDASAIVLAANVQLDSVSAKVLAFLEQVEAAVIHGESIGGKFYAILYTDLYEAEQTSIAMGVLKNFCVRANITWGRGLGIGGNGIKESMTDRGIWKILKKKSADFRLRPLHEQALFIKEKMQGGDAYVKPEMFSRGTYIRKINRAVKKNNRVKIAQS